MDVVLKKPKRTAQMHRAPLAHEQWQPGNPCALSTCRSTLMLPHQVRKNETIVETTGMTEYILAQTHRDFLLAVCIEKTKYNLKVNS